MENVIVTGMEYENIDLSKSFMLKKSEKKEILAKLYIWRTTRIKWGKKVADAGLVEALRIMRPSPNKFQRFRMFGDFIYDMNAILDSDNVEFNMITYLNAVCGFTVNDIVGVFDRADCFDSKLHNFRLAGLFAEA